MRFRRPNAPARIDIFEKGLFFGRETIAMFSLYLVRKSKRFRRFRLNKETPAAFFKKFLRVLASG